MPNKSCWIAGSVLVILLCQPWRAGAATQSADAHERFARQPIAFEVLHRKGDCPVHVARGPGYHVAIEAGTAALTMFRRARGNAADASGPIQAEQVAIRFLEAQPGTCPEATAPPIAVHHHYISRDPVHWRTQVPLHREVVQRSIYPGVDVIWYGRQRDLEFDLVLQPGADPTLIRIAIREALAVSLAPDGALDIQVAGGRVRQHVPRAYQEIGGRRVAVEAGYVLEKQPTGQVVTLRLRRGELDLKRSVVSGGGC